MSIWEHQFNLPWFFASKKIKTSSHLVFYKCLRLRTWTAATCKIAFVSIKFKRSLPWIDFVCSFDCSSYESVDRPLFQQKNKNKLTLSINSLAFFLPQKIKVENPIHSLGSILLFSVFSELKCKRFAINLTKHQRICAWVVHFVALSLSRSRSIWVSYKYGGGGGAGATKGW